VKNLNLVLAQTQTRLQAKSKRRQSLSLLMRSRPSSDYSLEASLTRAFSEDLSHKFNLLTSTTKTKSLTLLKMKQKLMEFDQVLMKPC